MQQFFISAVLTLHRKKDKSYGNDFYIDAKYS